MLYSSTSLNHFTRQKNFKGYLYWILFCEIFVDLGQVDWPVVWSHMVSWEHMTAALFASQQPAAQTPPASLQQTLSGTETAMETSGFRRAHKPSCCLFMIVTCQRNLQNYNLYSCHVVALINYWDFHSYWAVLLKLSSSAQMRTCGQPGVWDMDKKLYPQYYVIFNPCPQGWGQLHNINSTPTPTPEVSTPTPTPANLQNINSNSGGFNSNSNSNYGQSL